MRIQQNMDVQKSIIQDHSGVNSASKSEYISKKEIGYYFY